MNKNKIHNIWFPLPKKGPIYNSNYVNTRIKHSG